MEVPAFPAQRLAVQTAMFSVWRLLYPHGHYANMECTYVLVITIVLSPYKRASSRFASDHTWGSECLFSHGMPSTLPDPLSDTIADA